MVACMRWSFGSAQLVSCCCVCFLDTAIIKPHLLALRRQLFIHIIQQSVWCSQPELMLYLVARTILAKALYTCNMEYLIQYATDVEKLLFLARPEFLRETACVPHYFQYKEVTFLFFSQNLRLKSLIIRFLTFAAYYTWYCTRYLVRTYHTYHVTPRKVI